MTQRCMGVCNTPAACASLTLIAMDNTPFIDIRTYKALYI
jgi:hypothetical protein